MKIFLTGGTGFVGTEILKYVLSKDYEVSLLVRNPDKVKIKNEKIDIIVGDVLRPETYRDKLNDVDCVIHLVGIIREIPKNGVTFQKYHFQATKMIVDAAKEADVKRFIHMSANGARNDAITDYHKTKYLAEEYVRNSGLTYTIFKPSVIYGEGDSFINMLNDFLKKTPVFSYFGDGSYPMQPVYVADVAKIFVDAIENSNTFNKTFTVCGPKVLSYKELLKLICEVTNKKRLFIPIPEFIINIMIMLFGKFQWFPLTRDQFEMLREGNTCENMDIYEILGIKPKNLKEVLITYLK
ncbi:complex I NDUFA9 subunit family protein [Deferribacter thermophilus]|uniref:complex I NDUFA9 subunit family protein n=1 Tax=Deferribacter thermophilus TaxID=53573 RepID=UPI003C1BFE2C